MLKEEKNKQNFKISLYIWVIYYVPIKNEIVYLYKLKIFVLFGINISQNVGKIL